MKFIDLDDLALRPGRLTVWRATTATPAAPAATPTPDAWAPDGRPPSYLQQAYLNDALRHRTGPRPPAWLATAFELPGPLDATALRRALLDWIDRHETLRSRLTPHPDGDPPRLRRTTLSPGAADVQRTPRGEFTDRTALLARVERLLDARTDPLTWPSFVFLTVERLGSTTLLLGFDHHNVDGYSVFRIAREIHELYAAAREGRAATLEPVGGYPEFAETERAEAASLRDGHRAVERWRESLAETGGGLPGFVLPLLAPESAGRAPQTGACEWLLDAEEARAFDLACRAQDGTFLSGVLACLALAARERAGLRTFRTAVPFHTRREGRHRPAMGWYVGIAPVSVPVPDADDFGRVLKESTESIRRARPLADVPLARVAELLGRELPVRFMVSYMDLRHLPGSAQWTRWNATALRSRRVGTREVFLWVMRNHEGCYLSYRFPSSHTARNTVPRYLAEFRHRMSRVVAQQSPHPTGTPAETTATGRTGRRDAVEGKEPAPCG
ncbi:condensation domain-containing protein [Streptomyces sp. NPDC000983]|uniref:condensation domain-containing protein n=1 Tax=Streptomyces sp. NPDC000983 TaxID=3154373 RepID=UPI003318532E